MTCEHCGSALPAFALFCGECGRSVAAPPLVAPMVSLTQPPAVPLITTEPEVAPEPEIAPEAEVAPDEDDAAVPGPDLDPPVAPLARDAAAAPPLSPCPQCGAAAEPDDRFCAECGTPLATATRIIEPIIAAPAPEQPVPAQPVPAQPVPAQPVSPDQIPPPTPVPLPEPAAPPAPVDLGVDESTRLVPRGTGGARFVLQFSTGESYTVLGSGLAGRNPRPEPGEYVDHLVTIVDPGRSVSKTHFEFGQESGVFWFADRHSGNGSVIREPGAAPRPCVPGHRYPVVRGTRIDIGEQFVVVS